MYVENIMEIINSKLRIKIDNMPIERCHWPGKYIGHGKQSHPIIVNKKNLKGTYIFLKEDFPIEVEKKRSTLMLAFLAALNRKI